MMPASGDRDFGATASTKGLASTTMTTTAARTIHCKVGRARICPYEPCRALLLLLKQLLRGLLVAGLQLKDFLKQNKLQKYSAQFEKAGFKIMADLSSKVCRGGGGEGKSGLGSGRS